MRAVKPKNRFKYSEGTLKAISSLVVSENVHSPAVFLLRSIHSIIRSRSGLTPPVRTQSPFIPLPVSHLPILTTHEVHVCVASGLDQKFRMARVQVFSLPCSAWLPARLRISVAQKSSMNETGGGRLCDL